MPCKPRLARWRRWSIIGQWLLVVAKAIVRAVGIENMLVSCGGFMRGPGKQKETSH